jgi:predicted metal-binding membrane protein
LSAPAPPEASDAGGLERLLRRDRAVTTAGLVLLCALAWIYLLTGAGMPMRDAGMPAPGMADIPGMAPAGGGWSPGRWLVVVAMWWTMMVAMMTPSAAPTVLLYGRVCRRAQANGQGAGVAPTWAFAAGYLLVWLGFSVAAAAAQRALQESGLLSTATLGSQNRWFSAAVLAAAGLYQLTPLQGACLGHCRAPASFLSRHWRPGTWGAVRLGAMHGGYCVGCCWLLMALLFVAGVMNLVWIAVLTVLVLAEKLLPGGRWTGRAVGLALLVWATATLTPL